MEIKVDTKIAALFGASGLVGRACLNYLLASNAYSKVKIFVRTPLDIAHEKLVQYVTNFDALNEMGSQLSCDDVFVTLGTTIKKAGSRKNFIKVDFTYVYTIAKLTLKLGASQFVVVSSVGASESSNIFYLQVKGIMETKVRSLPFWAIHIFRPSFLLGERVESRLGENVAKKLGHGINYLTGGLLKKYRPVESDEVARGMVYVAQRLKEGVFIYYSDDIPQMHISVAL